jgi:hypothetical protein
VERLSYKINPAWYRAGYVWERVGETHGEVERQSGRFSRDGATVNLMKTLSEVIVAVAFEPSGKIP